MIEELQQPSVIDLESLLQPVPGENPSGESLRYEGVYDQISEARRADEDLNQGAWQTELKFADYRGVIGLAVPALQRSKDLQIGAWLSEALIREHGFVGLRDSLKLLSGLQENFWETLHPEIDEGDESGRANAISWFETQGSMAIKRAPFTGSEGYGLLDWEDSRIYDFPDNISSLPIDEQTKINKLKEEAENKRRVTSEMWRREIADTRRRPVEIINFTIEECVAEIANLNRVIEQKFDRNQVPGISALSKALDEVHTQVKKLLEAKRAEEPDEVEEEEVAEGEAGAAGDGAAKGATASGSGPIQSRRDALKRLADVADYFQKTEPHSPISYIVQRAVKWGNMPLELWLKDVIKDENVIGSIRQTLGFNTVDGDGAPPQA